MDAYRQGDTARCLDLMDEFSQSAEGLELGQTLRLKASFIMMNDARRCSEGLSLVEEALSVAPAEPELQMKCAVDGLGLCFLAGDITRATRYEVLGHHVIRQYGDEEAIIPLRWHFHFNLAHIASLKLEHTQAYWNLVQGTQVLLSLMPVSAEMSCQLFRTYLRTADVCLEMNRSPEADDALTKAKAYCSTNDDELQWMIYRAAFLLQTNQPNYAKSLLDELATSHRNEQMHPFEAVRFDLTRSLVAQALGDVRSFHVHLAKAQQGAVDHGLDFMLCRIQRLMRTPAKLEAVR